jgi:hypothetical protein
MVSGPIGSWLKNEWLGGCGLLPHSSERHTHTNCGTAPEVRIERKPIALVVDRNNEVDWLPGQMVARVLLVIAVVVAAVAVMALLLLLLLLKLRGEKRGRKRTETRTIAIAVAAAGRMS